MRILLQRCSRASVTVDGQIVGAIDHGLVALVGIGHEDDESIVAAMAAKTLNLRIFNDAAGKMNRSIGDVGGDILAISQFTLMADCRRGRRPAFTDAAAPAIARVRYDSYVDHLRRGGLRVPTGVFAADMKVELVNDGPVTILLD